ncbi:GntR family transcriptional regulator [Thermostaphylospora chromogena]|uniref:GntR family transcriptional regulator n=1 Tax=Thermostaphylospora chromogena TaxID=35622 RepID=UPI001A960679|nr:GntR family transcriptional regulator [Thermostaphylospora chromogena]
MTDAIDHDAPTPVYKQLAAILRRRIEAGDLVGRLPAEADLMEIYGLGRDSVRKGLTLLKEAGLIESVQGRGTFVVPPDQRPKGEPESSE